MSRFFEEAGFPLFSQNAKESTFFFGKGLLLSYREFAFKLCGVALFLRSVLILGKADLDLDFHGNRGGLGRVLQTLS